jgi:hypothetical protein
LHLPLPCFLHASFVLHSTSQPAARLEGNP